jgi:hypothetical protein
MRRPALKAIVAGYLDESIFRLSQVRVLDGSYPAPFSVEARPCPSRLSSTAKDCGRTHRCGALLDEQEHGYYLLYGEAQNAFFIPREAVKSLHFEAVTRR